MTRPSSDACAAYYAHQTPAMTIDARRQPARRKRGRPPKPAADKASRRVSFYVTEADYQAGQRLAALGDETIAEFARGRYADAIEECGALIVISPRTAA